ncbi:MAG TPA: L,D-transpeptidase [Chthoniobacterales bacterium]
MSIKATTTLALALVIIGAAPEVRAQHTSVVINLTKQMAYLLENGRVALVPPIASGKEGWGTPTGRFHIIKKDLNHVSADFDLVVDSYGRIVNPNATPSSPMPPARHADERSSNGAMDKTGRAVIFGSRLFNIVFRTEENITRSFGTFQSGSPPGRAHIDRRGTK